MDFEKRTVLVLSATVYLVMLGMTIISPVLPFYGERLGATTFMVGALISIYAVARVIFDIPAGVFGDKYGHKPMMSSGLILIVISSVIAGFALDYWMLFSMRAVEGIGSAFYVTSSTSILAKVIPMERRGRYMSYYVSSLLLGVVSGPAIGGYVAHFFGLNTPFFFYAISAGAGLVLIRLFLGLGEDGPLGQKAAVRISDIREILSNRSFLLVNIGTLGAFFVRGGINGVIFPLFANRNLGYETDIIGLMLTISALASLATMTPSGTLADKYGRKVPFVMSLVLTGLSVQLIFLAKDFLSLVLAMIAYGLFLGLHGPMAAWAADLAPKSSMGTAMGIYRMVGDVGWVIGPMALTATSELTDSGEITIWPFALASIWLMASSLMLIGAKDPAGGHRKDRTLATSMGDQGAS